VSAPFRQLRSKVRTFAENATQADANPIAY
jgi:hypothetical protein